MSAGAVPDDLVLIGRLSRPHALQGEIRVYPFCDDDAAWDVAFEQDLFLRKEDGAFLKVRMASMRPHVTFILVRFEGIADRTDAEALEKTDLFIRRAALPDLEEDAWYACDLEGLTIVDATSGATLGTVKTIQDGAAQSLLVGIAPEGQTFHIPFHAAFVQSVDRSAGSVTVSLPPGLLDLND